MDDETLARDMPQDGDAEMEVTETPPDLVGGRGDDGGEGEA